MSFTPPGYPQPPTEYEPVPTNPRGVTWLFVALHLGFGIVTLRLAFDEEFAAGRAEFAADEWRMALGVAGGLVTLLGLRGLYLSISGYTATFSPEYYRRARIRGVVLLLVGIFFALAALNRGAGESTVEFDSWAKPLFGAGGIYLVLAGLVLQSNPTRALRLQRLRQGEGIHGVARILGATGTRSDGNDMPVMEVRFEIDVNGRVNLVTEKIAAEEEKMSLLVPGATVKVLVHRTDPSVFQIDWSSWRPPAG